MQTREIAAVTGISRGYLEQILSALRRSGLVSSVRGAAGGYTLAKPASQMSVLEIIETLEGPLCDYEKSMAGSPILENFLSDAQRQVRKIFALKLTELDQIYQPFHYEI